MNLGACFSSVRKCETQIYCISWLPDCQTESVGGDIHRGAFSGTFMRDFFPLLKGGWPHTVRFAWTLYAWVFLSDLPLSAPTWAARGVFGIAFCFGEPSLVLLRKCCRKQWELTPSSASVPLKKGRGLSGRGVGGGLSAWVCHSHVGGCPQSRRPEPRLFSQQHYCVGLLVLKVKSQLWRGFLANRNRFVGLVYEWEDTCARKTGYILWQCEEF